jgi:hypothetical protein
MKLKSVYTVKTLAIFASRLPERDWLLTAWLGTEKSLSFFYSAVFHITQNIRTKGSGHILMVKKGQPYKNNTFV